MSLCQIWGGAVGAVGDLISGVVGKTPWAPAPHARRLTGVTEHPLEDALLWLDVGRPDHLGPLLSVIGNEFAEGSGRPRQRRDGQIVKPRFQFGIGKSSINLPVQLVDDISGGVLGYADAMLTFPGLLLA